MTANLICAIVPVGKNTGVVVTCHLPRLNHWGRIQTVPVINSQSNQSAQRTFLIHSSSPLYSFNFSLPYLGRRQLLQFTCVYARVAVIKSIEIWNSIQSLGSRRITVKTCGGIPFCLKSRNLIYRAYEHYTHKYHHKYSKEYHCTCFSNRKGCYKNAQFSNYLRAFENIGIETTDNLL